MDAQNEKRPYEILTHHFVAAHIKAMRKAELESGILQFDTKNDDTDPNNWGRSVHYEVSVSVRVEIRRKGRG